MILLMYIILVSICTNHFFLVSCILTLFWVQFCELVLAPCQNAFTFSLGLHSTIKLGITNVFYPSYYSTKLGVHHTLQQPKTLIVFPHNTFLKHLPPNTQNSHNTHTFLLLNSQNSMKTRIPHTHITYTCNTSKPTSTSTTPVAFCYNLICLLFPHLIHTFWFCHTLELLLKKNCWNCFK